MDTIKTAFVVALLLAVLYGVYVVLNKEQAPSPPGLENIPESEVLTPPDIDMDSGPDLTTDLDGATGSAPVDREAPSVYQKSPAAADAGPLASLPATPPAYVEPQPQRADQISVPTEVRAATPDAASPAAPSIQPPIPAASLASAPRAAPTPTVPNAAPSGSGTAYGDPPSTELGAPRVPADPTSAAGDSGSVYSTPQPDAAPAPNDSGTAAAAGGADAANPVAEAMGTARELIAAREYAKALETLSNVYANPGLPEAEVRTLLELLDPLAGKVIYSPEHLLLVAHSVQDGETLPLIADRYRVPWQLLSNINGITDPNALAPGTELKVLPGPFHAVVDTQAGELTLYLNNLYAGRFVVAAGDSPAPVVGEYQVLSKREGREYVDPEGRVIPASDPRNPYGAVWLDLGGNGICIHGTPADGGAPVTRGCIGLGPRDAADVYAILSEGSRVHVVR